MRGSGLPSASRPSARTTAVTPEPQVVIVGYVQIDAGFGEGIDNFFARREASVLDESANGTLSAPGI